MSSIVAKKIFCALMWWAALAGCAAAQFLPAPSNGAAFPPLDQWKTAVLAGDSIGLKMLYSVNPPAQIGVGANEQVQNADAEVSFWSGLKLRSLNLRIVQSKSPQPGIHEILFQAELKFRKLGLRTLYVSEGQLWVQQGGQWRIAAGKRGDPARLEQPVATNEDLYPGGTDAKAEIRQALEHATREHKRVLVVFGANWCYDCHVLELAFHRPDLAPLLQKNYEVIHVDVGDGDKNQDLMKLYGVPMSKGIPGLAVLDGSGKLLYSQKNGEFERARSLAPEDLAQFLNKWKPAKP